MPGSAEVLTGLVNSENIIWVVQSSTEARAVNASCTLVSQEYTARMEVFAPEGLNRNLQTRSY